MKDNPEIFSLLLQGISPRLAAILLAVSVRYGMLIYDGETRKHKWIEGVICGLLVGATYNLVALIPYLPEGAHEVVGTALGGFVGFFGVEKLRDIAIREYDRRFGKR
jgi:phage holin, lambda family